MANGNSETATEERQWNGGNWALLQGKQGLQQDFWVLPRCLNPEARPRNQLPKQVRLNNERAGPNNSGSCTGLVNKVEQVFYRLAVFAVAQAVKS